MATRRKKPISGVAAQKKPTSSHQRRNQGRKRPLQAGQPYVTSKLTDELTKRLCVEIRRGLPFNACCRLVRLSERSFENWIKRAELEIEAGQQSEYVNFYHRIQEANAEALRTTHAAVLTMSPAWILGRRWSREYPSERQLMELSGKDGAPLVPPVPTIKIIASAAAPVTEFPYVDESNTPLRSTEVAARVPAQTRFSTVAPESARELEPVEPTMAATNGSGVPGRLSDMVHDKPQSSPLPDFGMMSATELNRYIYAIRSECDRRKR